MTDLTDCSALSALLLPEDMSGSGDPAALSAWLNDHQPAARQRYLRMHEADAFASGCFELFAQGRYQQLCDLLEPIAGVIYAHPLLAAIYGWSLHYQAEQLEAEAYWRWLEKCEPESEAASDWLGLHGLNYRALEAERRKDMPEVRRLAESVLSANTQRDSWLDADAWFSLGAVQLQQEGFQLGALQALTRAAGYCATAGLLTSELMARTRLVQCLWHSAYLAQGLEQVREIEELARQLTHPGIYGADYLLLQGCIYYEQDALAQSEACFERWLEIVQRTREDGHRYGAQLLTSIRLQQRRLPEARALLDQIMSRAIAKQDVSVQATLDQGLQMRWQVLNAIAWQDEAEMNRLATRLRVDISGKGRAFQHLSLALLLIDQQHWQEALQQLALASESLGLRHSRTLLVRVLTLQACVSERLGQLEAARRLLGSALRIVAETGCLRSILDEYFGSPELLTGLMKQHALDPA